MLGHLCLHASAPRVLHVTCASDPTLHALREAAGVDTPAPSAPCPQRFPCLARLALPCRHMGALSLTDVRPPAPRLDHHDTPAGVHRRPARLALSGWRVHGAPQAGRPTRGHSSCCTGSWARRWLTGVPVSARRTGERRGSPGLYTAGRGPPGCMTGAPGTWTAGAGGRHVCHT